jgi:hypothetical protein
MPALLLLWPQLQQHQMQSSLRADVLPFQQHWDRLLQAYRHPLQLLLLQPAAP